MVTSCVAAPGSGFRLAAGAVLLLIQTQTQKNTHTTGKHVDNNDGHSKLDSIWVDTGYVESISHIPHATFHMSHPTIIVARH